MSGKRPKTEETLAKNLRYLMNKRGWTEEETAKQSGVSQKTVNNALNQTYKAKIETAEQLAAAFKLEGWHLIMPSLIRDLESGGSLSSLMANWTDADDEGKKFIEDMAEREAKRNRKAS